MICVKCGTTLVDGAKFCNECGQAVGGASPVEAPVAPKLQYEVGFDAMDQFLKDLEQQDQEMDAEDLEQGHDFETLPSA